MAESVASTDSVPITGRFTARSLLYALLPLALLAAVLALILSTGAGLDERSAPPIETVSFAPVTLPAPGVMEVRVVNDGLDPITIAQVLVDEAYWQFTQQPAGSIGRLESATFTIPYPWIEGESHAIGLISETGVVFETEIPVAIENPDPDTGSVTQLALIGLYVGIVPVALGLLWYPTLRRVGRNSMNFILALTVGLLLFLAVDMWDAAQEVALAVAGTFEAPVLIPLVALLTATLLVVAGQSLRARRSSSDRLPLAYQIAVGIGLHNLGEGLAIGAAIAIGEAALGVFLIVGFTLHNVTEGVGIAAPLVNQRPPWHHFITLALIAGGPAILGTWIGAFTYSPLWTTLFLAAGIGAIAQVVIEVCRIILRSQEQADEPSLTWTTYAGFAAGIAIMYATALLVTA